MIDQLRTMAIFQAVAELGSFRAAARKLDLSPSVISHHVSKLEAELGMPLLYRSTRRMSLTDAGAELLTASQRMSAAALDGLTAVRRRAERPTGRLTIAAATPLAHSPYVETFTRFARAHPGVHLDVRLDDDRVSLEGSAFDVAIRGSTRGLDDSSYRARRLGQLQFCMFAAPSYVQGRPEPRTVDDLADWDWVQSPPLTWEAAATLADGTPPGRAPRVAVTCNNFTLARRCVEAGLGFMVETWPLVADDIRAGRLVQLLPRLRLRLIDVYAMYPANSPGDGLAHRFIDFLLEQDWTRESGFAGG